MRILTAGYGNLGFEKFVERMHKLGVTHLVDVRAIPYSSYHEAFRRENLADSIPATGMKYVWMGDTLGGVKDSAVLCKDPLSVDLEPLRREERLVLGLDRLMTAAGVPARTICLMCGCLRPHKCHRGRLLSPELARRGVEVLHVMDDGRLESHSEVMEFIEPNQGALF